MVLKVFNYVKINNKMLERTKIVEVVERLKT
jgi:hypothetical protein